MTYREDDPRLSSHWKILHSQELPKVKEKGSLVVVSYPDDEGIRLNQGRPGAQDGPDRIRHFLGRLVHQGKKTPPLYVLNDRFTQVHLSMRHEAAEKLVRALLDQSFRVLTLGGGHDYGYPDSAAYRHITKGKVLNIDAHLDMRPVVDGKLNSGTPFRRYIEKFGGKSLTVWGAQPQCNSVAHQNFAKENSVKVLRESVKFPRFPGKWGLSICLDAFEGIRGVSAPASVGIPLRSGLECIRHYSKQSQWMGIYECAPKYDPLHEDSARYAALLAYHFIHRGMLG